MPKAKPEEPKQYLVRVPKKPVYAALGIFAVVAILLYLCVPHYKPLHLASTQRIVDQHHAIIDRYFLLSTVCVHEDDGRDRATRVKDFNRYFKVNKYGNRAVIRGCDEHDSLLAKDDQGKWQMTDVNITLNTRQNPEWQKACLIDDITTADTKVRPENSAIDANNLQLCNALAKQSYIEVNFKLGIHFHF